MARCAKPRIFFDKHPVLLFMIMYFSLLFVGSTIIALSHTVTQEDIRKAAPDYPNMSNSTLYVCSHNLRRGPDFFLTLHDRDGTRHSILAG